MEDPEVINGNVFYKKNKSDSIWWIENRDKIGIHEFSFDKKKIYNLFKDYPYKLSKEEKEIFDMENPYWKEFFKDRVENTISLKEAIKIVLGAVPKNYAISSASELDSGWIFSFCSKESDDMDEDSLFVSKIDGKVEYFIFEEHIQEYLEAEPIELSAINFDDLEN